MLKLKENYAMDWVFKYAILVLRVIIALFIFFSLSSIFMNGWPVYINRVGDTLLLLPFLYATLVAPALIIRMIQYFVER